MSQEDRNIAQKRRNANHAKIRAQQTKEQQQAVIDSRRLAQQSRRVNQCGNLSVQSRRINTENRRQQRRSAGNVNLLRVAFDYRSLPVVQIGYIFVVCPHCNALKFPRETPGLCCLSGKVKLLSPPKPLRSYLEGVTTESKQFLANDQNYNGCFQIINESGYNPSLKIQGQVHHRAGSLLPLRDGEYNFLQIYFIGIESDEINRRSELYNRTKEDIIRELQRLLHNQGQPYKVQKVYVDNRLVPCINMKAYNDSDQLMTLTDFQKNFFPHESLENCKVLIETLGVELYKGNRRQLQVLMENDWRQEKQKFIENVLDFWSIKTTFKLYSRLMNIKKKKFMKLYVGFYIN